MADLGKVVVTDGGNYNASVTYEKLTFVHYQGDAYMTLKTVKGATPSDDGINYKLFCKSAEIATALKAGIVMPDGETTSVDSNGRISAKKATTSAAGIVKPAASDFTVAADGTQKINTQFTQAATLANIIAGEAISTILGKVSKAIASTMNLDSNALLKNMLTSIQVNDSNKIPTAALAYAMQQKIDENANAITSLNGDIPFVEPIQCTIPENARYVDLVTSRTIKRLVSVLNTGGAGCEIIQAAWADSKRIRVYVNPYSGVRGITFTVYYIPT